jgi:PPOX class probable F420-dependent enzyme
MSTLDDVTRLAAAEQYLAVVSTVRADHTVQSSLVNAGVMAHPLSPGPVLRGSVLAFVTDGRAKLANLRLRPQVTVTFRSGWRWAAVEGTAQLIGPDDAHDDVDAERLRLMLREIFVAAGGTHDDWPGYDAAMVADRRTAVLIEPTRIYSN